MTPASGSSATSSTCPTSLELKKGLGAWILPASAIQRQDQDSLANGILLGLGVAFAATMVA